MKPYRLLILVSLFAVILVTLSVDSLHAQSAKKKKILVDIAHGQKFWNDPADMAGMDTAFVSRIKYMTRELKKNADGGGR